MNSIEICNLALGMLGIPLIVSFDEENENARLCRQLYPVCRDRCLRDHEWSFATECYDLPVSADTPWDPAYAYVCVLPPDLLRAVGLVSGHPFRRYSEHKIMVKDEDEKLIYIRRVENTECYDATFCEAMQYLLAAEIGMSNTKNLNLISYYQKQYEQKLAIARSIDSMENRSSYQTKFHSHFLASRWGD